MKNFITRGLGIVLPIFLLILFSSATLNTQTFTASISSIQTAPCNGLGSITASATGGTPPYTASIVSAENGNNYSETSPLNLLEGEEVTFQAPSGDYFVFFEDQMGEIQYCLGQGIIHIPNAPPGLTASATDLPCSGGEASATITAASDCPSNTSYNYTLTAPNGTIIGFNNTGIFTENINEEGIYTVNAFDDAGNNVSVDITIEATISHEDIGLNASIEHDCGTGLGTVTITAQGTPVNNITYYIYSPLTETISNTTGLFTVPAGTYTQWFEFYANGSSSPCLWECPIGFTVLSSDLSAAHYTTPTTCNASNGGIDLTVSGSNDFLVEWSDGIINTGISSTSVSRDGLAAGTYTYTVTDNITNCNIVNTTIVTSSNPFVIANQTIVDEICPAGIGESGKGEAKIVVASGLAPYTVALVPNIGTNSITDDSIYFSNLTSGSYTATVIDTNGCEVNTSFSILDPPNYNVQTVTQINPTCDSGLTGSAVIKITGGDSTREIRVSLFDTNGGFPITIGTTINRFITVPLSVGMNNFIFQLAPDVSLGLVSQCFDNFEIEVDAPATPELQATATVQSEVCLGASDGGFETTVTNYTGTETATLNGNPINIDNTGYIFQTNMSSGTYVLLVEEPSTGCTATDTIVILPGAELNINLTPDFPCSDNAIYYSAYDSLYTGGTITATVTGGYGGYSYLWDNGETVASLENVFSGTYSVTVTDVNGCQAVSTITVEAPEPLGIDIDIVDSADCYGDTITIKITGTGGTTSAPENPPYVYYVNGIEQDTNCVFVIPGDTTVLAICDQNGCFIRDTIVLGQPDLLVISATATNASCSNSNDGSIITNVVGGTSPYNYAWSDGSISANLVGVLEGTYTVTVTDANGCEAVTSAIVGYENTSPDIGYYIYLDPCGKGGDVHFFQSIGETIILNGIILPPNASSETLPDGPFTIEVISPEGCSTSITDTIESLAFPYSVTIEVEDACGFQGTAGITIHDSTGEEYNVQFGGESWDNISAGQFITIGQNLNPGSYDLRIKKSEYNCVLDTIIVITDTFEPLSIEMTDITSPSCLGALDGSFTYLIEGGEPGATYEYQFHNLDTTAWYQVPPSGIIEDLSAGEYQMVVRIVGGNSACGEICVPVTISPSTVNCSNDYFDLYPNLINTATTPLTITYNPSDLTGSYYFEIRHISGFTPLYSFASDGSGQQEEYLQLPPGIYIITLMDSNQGFITSEKFIVQ